MRYLIFILLIVGAFSSRYGRSDIFGRDDTIFAYLMIAISIFISAFGIFISFGRFSIIKYKSYPGQSFIDKISCLILFYFPFFIFCTWIYGVIIGLKKNIPMEYVFSNFAGLSAFIWFYSLHYFKPTFRQIVWVLFLSGLVQIIYGLLHCGIKIHDIRNLIYVTDFNSFRQYYMTGVSVLYPVFALGFYVRFFNKIKGIDNISCNEMLIKIISSIIFLTLSLYIIIYPSMSKGIIAGLILIIVYIIIDAFFTDVVRKYYRLEYLIYVSILLLIALLIFAFPNRVIDIFIYNYSFEERSNATRVEQYDYIVKDLSVFGSGLGAPLSSGYIRDVDRYGFELTYLNILHKLGVMAVPLFSFYIVTLLLAAYRLFNKILPLQSITVIGCYGIIILGIGNPVLLAPNSVILYCLGLYILLYPSYNTNPRSNSQVTKSISSRKKGTCA